MTVKIYAVSIASSLVVLISGCASEQVKETSAAPSASAPTAAPATPRSESRPGTAAVTPSRPMGNPLHDPNSILAKRSVYYDFDRYDVKSEFQPMVEAHAAYLRSHGSAVLRIEGNADERGSREYNLALGQRRADSVKAKLKLLGVNESQIETVSWGKEKPKAKGHDESAWSQNRRSDIVYTSTK